MPVAVPPPGAAAGASGMRYQRGLWADELRPVAEQQDD